MIEVLIGLYFLVAILSGVETYIEQQGSDERGVALRALGFLACALWPVTFVAVAIEVRRRTC